MEDARMTITSDPENHEFEALSRFSGGFKNQSVLEVGCGNGRLTWGIAAQARQVTGVDPGEEKIARARENTPADLADRIQFHAQTLEAFAGSRSSGERFDLALLSWSL
jgi:2-polyprenyl-3-methyl-5-hydroxy-6-metoxy-1,4-benzoquinol methylase